MTFISKVEIWQEKCIWPKHPSASARWFFAVLHPGTEFQYRRKKRISCIFGPSHFCPSPATSRGSNPSSVLRIVPPVCFILHLHTAEHEAKWATWQPTRATLQTTRNTHFTLHATLHATLPKCCQGQHFRSGQKNWLVFSFLSFKAWKLQNVAPASSSVVLRAV